MSKLQNQPAKVLIAEDDLDTRLLLKEIAANKGFVVVEADNGKEAIDLASSELPDLIVLDLSMPLIDGIEAAKVIRKSTQLSSIPILFMTAHGRLGISLFCEIDIIDEGGLIEYMSKPFTHSEFEDKLDQLCPPHKS
jgi:two-component system cell cycle response regulator DivK